MRLDAVPTEQRRIERREQTRRAFQQASSHKSRNASGSRMISCTGLQLRVFCFDFANAEYHRPD
jgi:hypothetical protein